MRKFKLIKTYPDCNLELGAILFFPEGTKEISFTQGQYNIFYTLEELEKYPEFFKEIVELCVPIGTKFRTVHGVIIYTISNIIDDAVIISWNNGGNAEYFIKDVNRLFKNEVWKVYEEPKEYEILSFKKYNKIYTVRQNGRLLLDCPEYYGLDADKNATHWTDALNLDYSIHSIKTLSDNEIFTIGDKIDGFSYKNRTLEAFELKENRLMIKQSGGLSQLTDVKHSKQKLFTTEDSVDIFEGDSYTIVRKGTVSKSLITFTYNAISNGIWKDSNIEKIFSTEEKAEEYILLNKPCLSIKEITPLFGQHHLDNSKDSLNKLTDKLKELVKSKI